MIIENDFILNSKNECYKIYGFRFIGKTSSKIEIPNEGRVFIIRNSTVETMSTFSIFEIDIETLKIFRMFKLSQIEEVIFDNNHLEKSKPKSKPKVNNNIIEDNDNYKY